MSIAFTSREVGYAAALCLVRKCGGGFYLYRTTDGGAAWRRLATKLGLTGFPALYTAPRGYISVVGRNGFAVLVPGIGWRVVRMTPKTPSAPSPYVTLVYSGVTAIAPGRSSALVIVPGAGIFTAPYAARSWHAP